MDTPAWALYATSGATETLTYLPKCDLGVVLIDAGSTLMADDLQTIIALQQAAIPVTVLLSKADLLGAEDRGSNREHVKKHIASECNLDVPVHPVSVAPSCQPMLKDGLRFRFVPLYARSQDLRAASLSRKLAPCAIPSLRRFRRACEDARNPQRNPRTRREPPGVAARDDREIRETRALLRQFIAGGGASFPEIPRSV